MKTKIFIIAAVLLAQIVGLFCVSVARERERTNAPKFLLECESYDPRHPLYGHYLPIRFKVGNEIPFSKLDPKIQEAVRKEFTPAIEKYLKDPESWGWYWPAPRDLNYWMLAGPNPETGLWEAESLTQADPQLNPNDDPTSGKMAFRCENVEMRRGDADKETADRYRTTEKTEQGDVLVTVTPQQVNAFLENEVYFYARCRLFDDRTDFYLSEKKAKEFDEKYRNNSEHVISAEVFLRDGKPVVTRIFVDGKEF